MEQKQRRDDEPPPEPEPVVTKGEFFKQVTVDRYDRFALVFFYFEYIAPTREL